MIIRTCRGQAAAGGAARPGTRPAVSNFQQISRCPVVIPNHPRTMDDLQYLLDGCAAKNRAEVRRQSAKDLVEKMRSADAARAAAASLECAAVLSMLRNDPDAYIARCSLLAVHNLSRPSSGPSCLVASLVDLLLVAIDPDRHSSSAPSIPNRITEPAVLTSSIARERESGDLQATSGKRRHRMVRRMLPLHIFMLCVLSQVFDFLDSWLLPS
jgi:hypothetical protein